MYRKVNYLAVTTISLIVATLFIALTSASLSQAPKSNFSGSWILNVEKSEFGNTPQNAAVKQFSIDQKVDSIYIDRITINANNEQEKSSEVLSFDGKECVKSFPNGRIKKSSVTWSPDGNVMTTVSSYSAPDDREKIDYVLTQTWEFANNNKELLVNLQSPAYTIKLIYDKQ